MYQRDQVVYDLIHKISKNHKKEELPFIFERLTSKLLSEPELLNDPLNVEDEFSGGFQMQEQNNRGNFESSFGNSSLNGGFQSGQDFFDLPPQPTCNMMNLWKLLTTAKKQAQLGEFDYQLLFHTGYQSKENMLKLNSELNMFFKQI